MTEEKQADIVEMSKKEEGKRKVRSLDNLANQLYQIVPTSTFVIVIYLSKKVIHTCLKYQWT